ncbi:MAG: hypothetical protein MJ002_02325 [Paludibacteraceae bacterium]|nr:hypothetical protein [Paludibacteraceae bacterium]
MELEYLTTLDERNRRLFMASKASSLGRHGVSLVSGAIHYCQSSPETLDHDFDTFAECVIAPHALFDVVGYMTIFSVKNM